MQDNFPNETRDDQGITMGQAVLVAFIVAPLCYVACQLVAAYFFPGLV